MLAMEQAAPQGPPTTLLAPDTLALISNKIIPSLKATLEEEKEVGVLRWWGALVRLMGRHLHTKTALLNTMMTVVERAFKEREGEQVLVAAFEAWQVLMDNFALEPKVLRNQKRINLLVRPFTIRNVAREEGYRAKLRAWWHLIHLLGDDLVTFTPSIVLPFLSFCFGGARPTPSPSSAATPQSPAKKFSGLARLALEALVLVLGRRPPDQALPRPALAPLAAPALTPLTLCESMEVVMGAVVEATTTTAPGNRTDLLRVEEVWRGMAGALATLSSSSSQTAAPREAVKEGVARYFAGVREVVVTLRRKPEFASTLLAILASAAALPARLLGAPAPRAPALALLELLLYPDFLTTFQQGGAFKQHYTAALASLAAALLAPSQPLAPLATLLSKLETLAPGLPAPALGALAEVWRALATTTTSRESLAEGGGFALSLRLLAFPPTHLAACHAEPALWAAWSRLYSGAAAQAEVAVGLPTAHLAHELGERLPAVLGPPDATTPAMLAAYSTCIRCPPPSACSAFLEPRTCSCSPAVHTCTCHLQSTPALTPAHLPQERGGGAGPLLPRQEPQDGEPSLGGIPQDHGAGTTHLTPHTSSHLTPPDT